MTERKSPEKARASPQGHPPSPRLSGKIIKSIRNPRLEKGGEVFTFETVKIVDEEVLNGKVELDEKSSALEPLKVPTQKKEVSVMLVLQFMTLVVAVVALTIAL